MFTAPYKIWKIRKPCLRRIFIGFLIALSIVWQFWDSIPLAEPVYSGDSPARFYANQNHDNLTEIFLDAIDSAQKSILLIVYSLTDPLIMDALHHKSQKGIQVGIITDAKTYPSAFSGIEGNMSIVKRFIPGLMHQKILVIDEKKILLGSANMTPESLQMHGNLVAALESPQLAEYIHAKAKSVKVEGQHFRVLPKAFQIGGQSIEMRFLPDDQQAIDRIIQLIRSAKKTIRIAMFTWTRHDLAKEVIDAAKRGIDAEVVIDNYQGKGAGAKIVKMLKKSPVKTSLSPGGPLLHHKFVCIDDDILVHGSANWTKAAFSQNDDCLMIIQPLTEEQKSSMKDLWNAICAESLSVE